MKRHRAILILLCVLALMSLSYGECLSHDLTLNKTPVQVYFGPFGGCTPAIVKEIGNAKNQNWFRPILSHQDRLQSPF